MCKLIFIASFLLASGRAYMKDLDELDYWTERYGHPDLGK